MAAEDLDEAEAAINTQLVDKDNDGEYDEVKRRLV